MDLPVRREDWRQEATVDPLSIRPPGKMWTASEMQRIALGFRPVSMDDKWFLFMEADVLHFIRSWTGHSIFEARFSERSGGWLIEQLTVCGDSARYVRESDDADAQLVERLIEYLLVGR